MPPHRLPVAELESRGSFQKNPQRRRYEPKTAGALRADPPPGLTPAEETWWHWFIANSHRDVLSAGDLPAVMMACRLMAEADEVGRDFTASKIAALVNLLGRLGLTPADRSKVAALDGKEKARAQDPWAEFDAITIGGKA